MSLHNRIGLGFIVCFLSALPLTSLAANGRDFAGFYEIRNVVDMGDQASVTLIVQPMDYSGADVFGATITVRDAFLINAYATFIVDLPNRETTVLQSDITFPKSEYERWRQGVPPVVLIRYTDAAGKTHRGPIELVPMIIDGGF